MVGGADTELVERAVIVSAKALKEAVKHAFAAVGPVSELVAVEVIDSGRNEDILEDVEWSRQALDEVIEQVVVGIGAVVEQGPKRDLPFLSLQDAFGIRLPAIESQEIVLAYRSALWARRELQFCKIRYEIGPIDESDFGIKVGLYLGA